MNTVKSIAVFCGSSSGTSEIYRNVVKVLSGVLIERHWGLVYGGGHVGLMGILADSMIAGGGYVTGVIPRFLLDKEVAHMGLPELVVVETMHERKMRMFELSAAFIALPGGFGTLDELFEIVTWSQLGLHDKPIGMLNIHGFYDPLLTQWERMIGEGFLKQGSRELIVVDDDPVRLLAKVEAYDVSKNDKWVRRHQT